MKILGLFLLFTASAVAAPMKKEGAPRTVMVQLFEWSWNHVAEECEEVLGPAGFAAVQVSPPTEHVVVPGSPWWERYQPVSHKLVSRSGTEEEFGAMVKRCAAAGVDVYADVILNHMAGRHEGVGFAGSSFTHYEYPGLFSYDDFHHCGRNGNNHIVDFTDLYELQHCMLLNLADLATGKESVRDRLAALLNRLLDLGVAGFRVDAAKHMPHSDIAAIFAKTSRPFYAVHELIISPGEPVKVSDYLPTGDVNVFPYAYGVGRAFLSGDLRSLPDLIPGLGVRSTEAVVLLENHDLERRPWEETVVPFVKHPKLHRLANVFMLTYPYGYPQLYSGYSFDNYDDGPVLGLSRCEGPWTCAHRDPDTLALVNFRNRTDAEFRATDLTKPKREVLAYGRGHLGHVVINGSDHYETVEVRSRLKPGVYCNILGEGCKNTAQVDKRGLLKVSLPPHSAFVALP